MNLILPSTNKSWENSPTTLIDFKPILLAKKKTMKKQTNQPLTQRWFPSGATSMKITTTTSPKPKTNRTLIWLSHPSATTFLGGMLICISTKHLLKTTTNQSSQTSKIGVAFLSVTKISEKFISLLMIMIVWWYTITKDTTQTKLMITQNYLLRLNGPLSLKRKERRLNSPRC